MNRKELIIHQGDYRIVTMEISKILRKDDAQFQRTTYPQGTLREPCSYCDSPECDYDCDQSSSVPDPKADEERSLFNVGMLAVERLLLWLSANGIDLDENLTDDAVSKVRADLRKICETKVKEGK